MNPAVLFVLTGTRGGKTRLRGLEALDDHAQNTHHLAETLDVSQSTLDHQLTILRTNGLIEEQGVHSNGVYQITRQTRADWDDIEQLLEPNERAAPPLLGILMG